MKNKIQSTIYIVFVLATFFALVNAFKAYQNPLSIYEHPLVWLALIGFITVTVLKEVVNVMARTRAKQLQDEKDGVTPEPANAWVKKFLKRWTKAKAVEEEGEIVLDHNYDGIKELDNSLPPWWVYLFYVTIIFAVVYLVRFHIMGGDTPEMEYEKKTR